jgi:hypothetical protein
MAGRESRCHAPQASDAGAACPGGGPGAGSAQHFAPPATVPGEYGPAEVANPVGRPTRISTAWSGLAIGRGWPLARLLTVQAALTLRLVWSHTASAGEALNLSAGRLELAHLSPAARSRPSRATSPGRRSAIRRSAPSPPSPPSPPSRQPGRSGGCPVAVYGDDAHRDRTPGRRDQAAIRPPVSVLRRGPVRRRRRAPSSSVRWLPTMRWRCACSRSARGWRSSRPPRPARRRRLRPCLPLRASSRPPATRAAHARDRGSGLPGRAGRVPAV